MRWLGKSIAACFILGAGAFLLHAPHETLAKGKGKDKPKVELKVKIGDPVPAFECVDDAGKPIKSSDLVGKKTVVVFFYPADFTANAVAQARGYQDDFETFSKAGAVVIGISGDSPETHKLFKSYYKLPFNLLSDEKGDAAKSFGIPVGKAGKTPTIDGKDKKGEVERAVSIARFTIVIDKGGKIAAIDAVPGSGKGAGVGDDAKRVLAIVKKLDGK